MSERLQETFSGSTEKPVPLVLIVDGSYTIADEPIGFFEGLGVDPEAIVHVTNAEDAEKAWRENADTLRAVVMSNRLAKNDGIYSHVDFYGEGILRGALKTLYGSADDRPFVIFNSFDSGQRRDYMASLGVKFPDDKNDFEKFADELRQRLGLQSPEASPEADRPDSRPS